MIFHAMLSRKWILTTLLVLAGGVDRLGGPRGDHHGADPDRDVGLVIGMRGRGRHG